MEVEIKLTDDGSNTLYNRKLNEHYHSTYGAVQESMHVFIHAGLKYINKTDIKIFEMGFGTGLNTLLTFLHRNNFANIDYHAIELYPLEMNIIKIMGYDHFLNLSEANQEIYKLIQTCHWEIKQEICPGFNLKKVNGSILESELSHLYDLVYYDAFAPSVQPELWTAEIFEKIYRSMNPDAVLVTYCGKGDVRRAMQSCGFKVERIPGPPGKFHMLRAFKK